MWYTPMPRCPSQAHRAIKPTGATWERFRVRHIKIVRMLPTKMRAGKAVVDSEHHWRFDRSGLVLTFNCAKTVKIGWALLMLLTNTNPGRAQAWVSPAGEGSVTFIYQTLNNTGHRATNGHTLPVATSFDMPLYFEAEYAFTNRVSLIAGLPYVFAKYTDSNPPPSPIPYLPVDECHCWQSGWQDFGITARYNLADGAFGLTPFVSLGVPSQNYNFRG